MKIHHSHAFKGLLFAMVHITNVLHILNGSGRISYLMDHNKLFFNESTDRVNGLNRSDHRC